MSTSDAILDSARAWVGSADPGESLRSRLTGLRRIRLWVGGIAGLIRGCLAFLGTLAAWVWMDLVLNLSPGLRLTAWLSAFAMLLFFAIRVFLKTRADSRSESLAQELDVAGNTGGEIRSGLDLAGQTGIGLSAASPQLSAQLASIAVRRASVLVRGVPDHEVASLLPAFKSAAALGATFFILLLAVLSGPRAAWTEASRFFNPWGDHPAYSRYAFEVTTDTGTVLYGEDLEIAATVEGPDIDQVELVLVPPASQRQQNLEETEPLDVLPMFPDPSGSWHASIAGITRPFDFYLRVRKARSVSHEVAVITVPEIRNVEAEITAPLYTGLSVSRGSVPASGLEGLPGTKIRISVESNRPLSGGTLQYTTPSGTAATAFSQDADKHTVFTTFEITESGTVDIQIVDEAGQPSTESYSVPLRALKDLSPIVRMMQPKATSFATPTAKLPVAVSAEDDFGLRRCQLFRSLNSSRFLATDLNVATGTPRHLQTGTILPLAEYDLQPGDEIRLFARVEDNDPNGPDAPIGKGSESSIVTVRIISQQDFDRIQQQKDGMKTMKNRYQQAQRRLENLADSMQKLVEELEQAPADSRVADNIQKEMQQLAEQMLKESDAIQKLGKKPLPLDLDKQLSPQLKEMAERIRKISEQLSRTAGQQDATSQQSLEELQEQLAALKDEQKRHQAEAMQPLEHLERVLPLKQAESEFAQLAQRQRQLADRLQSLKNNDVEEDAAVRARMRELEEEQHRIREQLNDLVDRIEEHAGNLPDDSELSELRETAMEFAKAVRESQASSEMASAEGSLAEFNGSQGHQHADKAASLLEALMSNCSGMGQACENSVAKFGPGAGRSLSETLGQLSPGMQPGQNSGSTPATASGMGSGGGSSSQMSTMKNVGMYGGLPQYEPTNTTMGESESDNMGGVFSDPFARNRGDSGGGFTGRQTDPAFGGSDWGVPVRYRRQAGKYLQGLAEDLEE